ncbi:MAG: hypothetical protein VB101_09850 [Rhodospirillaceae bacterium]|nr:hypothetical protein [Rhodospirillaceae bacterium]
MTGSMKTPGVYIAEGNAFPKNVAEVATAIPAFVGYTEKADDQGKSLSCKPQRVASLADYQHYFGAGPSPRLIIAEKPDGPEQADFTVTGRDGKSAGYTLRQADGKDGGRYLLHTAMRHFFQNGGGSCSVVSVGHYGQDLDRGCFCKGVDALLEEPEPTMLVIPEAVLLAPSDCAALQRKMLDHCGHAMKNRIAILDIPAGDRPRNDPAGDPVARFRESIGSDFLDYGTAYYPWLDTTIIGRDEIDYRNIGPTDVLQTLLRREVTLSEADGEISSKQETILRAIAAIGKDLGKAEAATLHRTLLGAGFLYDAILDAARATLNRMPPCAAMAGIYAMVDTTRGVWKAPANVKVAGSVAPAVALSTKDLEDLNVPLSGKSVNAIRSLPDGSVMVWGARTLDGNSLDWRYINVRRTEIMLRQSCALAVKAYAFEPNVASTWVTVRSMLDTFLTGVWKRGGLAGAVPGDAFAVHCGLGDSMTAEDVSNGVLRVCVEVALARPAEFLSIKVEQKIQKP